MHNRNRTIAVEGVLALLAFALMLGAAARALQPHPDPSPREQPISLQEPQTPPTPQQPDAPPPDSKAAKSTIFTGTIVKHGSDFVLRDQSGAVYRLDAPSKAQPYEGKPVKVTGKLESTARLIHVENIEEITA
jgi:hypothetical protein